MTAATVSEPAGLTGPDPVTARLTDTLAWIGDMVAGAEPVDDALRIDRIALAERLKAALDALQAVEIVDFARSQVAEQQRLDVDPARVGRGIADQVALACKVTPTEGSRRLHVARDLCLDMPTALGLLSAGEIGGWTARLVVGELSHLDRSSRRLVDAELGRVHLEQKSPRAAAATARRLVYIADPAGAVRRGRRARSDRRVTLRPAPDTMSILSGLLPVEQGVACLAALQTEAARLRAAGDDRGRGQIMADTLVERITGQARASDLPVEVQIVMPLACLLDPDDATPSDVADHGPVPPEIVREIIDRSRAGGFWRRLFTKPTARGDRVVVGIDERRRRFNAATADLIGARDRHCRDPFCTAPIRHCDHIVRFTDGGPTTSANGRGVCERGNYVRELPGWSIKLVDPDSHTVLTTTPTGHHYLSRPDEPP